MAGTTHRRRTARVVLLAALCVAALAGPASPAGSLEPSATASVAAPGPGWLTAKPAEIDFKAKRVGTENYKRTRITNTGPAAVRLVVEAGLPDDFGFGLMPGQTCPVFSPGELLDAGDSCYAVVRFSPSEGFIGWQARGELIATATEPATSTILEQLVVPVLGRAVA